MKPANIRTLQQYAPCLFMFYFYLQVVYVCRLEMLLQVFNLGVQRDAEHVDFLQVLIVTGSHRRDEDNGVNTEGVKAGGGR